MISMKYYISKNLGYSRKEGSEQSLNFHQGSDLHIRLKEDKVDRRVARYSLGVLQFCSLQLCSSHWLKEGFWSARNYNKTTATASLNKSCTLKCFGPPRNNYKCEVRPKVRREHIHTSVSRPKRCYFDT